MTSKKILSLDFDGVIHSYTSRWIAADFIPDPPVPGAMEFLYEAIQHFDVKIYSTRSEEESGRRMMALYIHHWAIKELSNHDPDWKANALINYFAMKGFKDAFPTSKPPAAVSLDDRVITFTGTWPTMKTLLNFKPWNKP